uniref:Uncharacterized protein n=1 Tax=Sphaerodactylus townsendi TaxID=933632 RepID=A0ACB8FDR1_9SAUR
MLESASGECGISADSMLSIQPINVIVCSRITRRSGRLVAAAKSFGHAQNDGGRGHGVEVRLSKIHVRGNELDSHIRRSVLPGNSCEFCSHEEHAVQRHEIA